jgi:hypothetical protein
MTTTGVPELILAGNKWILEFSDGSRWAVRFMPGGTGQGTSERDYPVATIAQIAAPLDPFYTPTTQ